MHALIVRTARSRDPPYVFETLSSVSGYRPLINPPPVPRKSTFRYNSMFNFIPVSFCFFVNFRVRVRVRVYGYGSGSGSGSGSVT